VAFSVLLCATPASDDFLFIRALQAPLSLQLIGYSYEDEKVLAALAVIEEVLKKGRD
jgi:Asp-tRNA(Asn)/Glu-tRNA(Gln) amidotransferase A subunit family amidase